jgi:hypothetical protein
MIIDSMIYIAAIVIFIMIFVFNDDINPDNTYISHFIGDSLNPHKNTSFDSCITPLDNCTNIYHLTIVLMFCLN